MSNKISVLDNVGFVRLIDSMGDDLSIVRNARVSYNAAWRAGENKNSDSKLINFLMKNRHNTPFESVTFTFEVKAPIFVLRQWHRHRTQSYNEISARYKELPNEFYIPKQEYIGNQSKDNKQVRDLTTNKNSEQIQNIIARNNRQAFERYNELLNLNTPKELARTVLPVTIYSHMFATANLHNWFGFLRERLHPHAQYEINEYAQVIFLLIRNVCPTASNAFLKTLPEFYVIKYK